jgi:hypothetical protein
MALIVIEGQNGVGFEFFSLSCPFMSLPIFLFLHRPTAFFASQTPHFIQDPLGKNGMAVGNGSSIYWM